MALVLAITSFLTVVFIIWGLSGRRDAERRMVHSRLTSLGNQAEAQAAPSAAQPLLRKAWRRQAASRWLASNTRDLEQAGMSLRARDYLTLRLVVAFILLMLALAVARNPLVALALAALGYLLPRWYVAARRRRRLARLDDQLSELLVLLSNSLKTGYGLLQSLDFASNQLAAPLASELKIVLRDINLGVPAEAALTDLRERMDSVDVDLMVTAIAIHRSVGGNLSELLDSVASTMRERERLRGQIRTLTAQQRMTGIIIGFLPVGIGLLFFAINPEYMSLLFTTLAGRLMLGAAAAMEALGILVIRKIVAIEV